jgi:hypothetical protein
MMRVRRLILVLALGCLGVTTALAQESNLSAGAIATAIDAGASAYGLPGGNGAISPAEQALGNAISQEVAAADQSISAFAQSSPAAGNLVDALENHAAQSFDPRADAISGAVEQYGQDSGNPPAFDPRADALSGAIAQYGQETANAPVDPRAAAISGAVEQYGQADSAPSGFDPRADAISGAIAQYGQPAPDPRAQIISDAVAQYGQEQGPMGQTAQGQQRIDQAIERGVNSAVDGSSLQHKATVKKRIQQLVQIEVPGTHLPINGYWRVRPFSMTSSGACKRPGGDNGGPDGNGSGENADPGRPLCGYANSPELPYLVWDGEDLVYLPGTGSLYAPETTVTMQMLRDSSGQSTGSLKVTTTREYRVVSPSKIQVHLLIQEDGGCSLSADYELELVTADDSICPADDTLSTPTPEPTEPPETQGPFKVGLPFYNNEADCDDSNRPPTFGDVFLRAQAGDAMLVDYGSGQQMTFADGWSTYSYDSGNLNGPRLLFGLTLLDSGGGSIFWSKKNNGGEMCVATFDLVDPAQPVATVAPAPDGSSDGLGTAAGEAGDSDADGFVLPTGHFTVTWAEYAGLPCAAALVPKLPRFAEADISALGGAYQLVGAGVTYGLQKQGGTYIYMAFGADNNSAILSFNGFDADGNVSGSYVYAASDGSNCMNALTLKKD